MSTAREIDRLYALPLGEFTAARNQLAKELRSAGDRSAADEVRALAKPAVGAWAVNQLFHTDRPAFDRLLEAGAAQRRALAGGSKPGSGDKKREALNELLRQAQNLLEKAGSKWTPSLRQRVHRTLEALASLPADARPPLGRLTLDLQPAGFDALLGAKIAPAQRAARKTPGGAKAARAGRTAAAAKRLKAARAKVKATRSELTRERRKKSAAARELTRLERRLDDAREKARAAEKRAEKARQQAEELELATRRARSNLDRATSSVARLEARLESETDQAAG